MDSCAAHTSFSEVLLVHLTVWQWKQAFEVKLWTLSKGSAAATSSTGSWARARLVKASGKGKGLCPSLHQKSTKRKSLDGATGGLRTSHGRGAPC